MLSMTVLDWSIIGAVVTTTMLLGILVGLRSGKNRESFFLGGRSLPWWLLGTSMVATTFSTDTPNLVTDLVRGHGVFGNWAWWCFLPTGMTTVFLYAKLWRRLGAVTDMEFYEIRYSGRAATFLRGFRAIYLGLFFNVMTLAAVSLAAIQIGAAMLGLTPGQSVCYAMAATVLFTSIGGFRGVIFTDFLLFFLAMVGAVAAAFFAVNLPEVGGIGGLLDKFAAAPELQWKFSPVRWGSPDDLIAFVIVPFAITWWSIWYPGAEPGGGGFLVQRMMAAKNEKHAMAAVMFFNVAHYALRPWPWIVVALASLIVYPDLAAIRGAVGHLLPESQCGHDTAYSLMLAKMPPRLARVDGGKFAGGLHVNVVDAAQLGFELLRQRRVEALHPPESERTGTGLVRPGGDVAADGAERAAGAPAPQRDAGVSTAAVDRGGNGIAVSAALVLVADQRRL